MESKRDIFRQTALELLYGDYETPQNSLSHPAYSKIRLQGIVRCYQRNCDSDPDLENLFNAVLHYASINPATSTSYESESLLLGDIVRYANIASVSTEREFRLVKKGLALYRKTSNKLQAEEKKTSDVEGLLKYEHAETGVTAAYALRLYFDRLVFGSLPASEFPEELFHEEDPEEASLRHPVFSHEPLGVDISDESRDQSPFFIALSNYAKKATENLFNMFCDCGEGIVMVRLWNPETMEPVYVSVKKEDVYFDWIVIDQNPTLWPGLLCRALDQSGHDVRTSDPELLMRMISGKDELLSAEDWKIFNPAIARKTPDTTAYESFFRCLNDICIALLGTMNVNIQETAPSFYLFEAVKTVIGSVYENFSDDLELLRPAMNHLAQRTKEYREFADPSPRRKRRLEICDSIDQLMDIYNDPDLRYTATRFFRSPLGRKLK